MDAPVQVELITADALALQALLREHDDPRGAVVLVRGLSGSKEHPQVQAVAEAVYAAGYTVLTYDGRGHGDSAGLCNRQVRGHPRSAPARAGARDGPRLRPGKHPRHPVELGVGARAVPTPATTTPGRPGGARCEPPSLS